jgi:protein MAK16
MQNDEMIWQVINHQFCSYKTVIGKAKSDKTTFCQHPYSVTGLCNRTSCPLANSLYATLREESGKVYLYMKTVERAHSPKNLWEKILLSRNYSKALTQIEEHLQHFPKVLQHRNKQRLTKIHQYLLRMRKLKLKELAGHKAKIVSAPTRKIKQREARREQKALIAARITQKVEQELVDRLAKGTYGDIYNFEQTTFRKALEQMEDEKEVETETESDEESLLEYVENLESDEDEESLEEDLEDLEYFGAGSWGNVGYQDEEETDRDNRVSHGGDDADDDIDTDDGDDDNYNDDDDDDDDDDDNKDDIRSSEENEEEKKFKRKPLTPKKNRVTKASRRKGSKVEIEYEEENDEDDIALQQAGMAW